MKIFFCFFPRTLQSSDCTTDSTGEDPPRWRDVLRALIRIAGERGYKHLLHLECFFVVLHPGRSLEKIYFETNHDVSGIVLCTYSIVLCDLSSLKSRNLFTKLNFSRMTKAVECSWNRFLSCLIFRPGEPILYPLRSLFRPPRRRPPLDGEPGEHS